MNEPQSSLLNGIIFGINISHKNPIYTQLQQVGLLHLVVLSGSNILFLCAITSKISSFSGRYLSSLITILIVAFFVCFVCPQAPIVRAAICQILTLVAYITGKKTIPLFSLLLSFIFILIFYPQWLGGVSLYLSYGASLGLILFVPKTISDRTKLSLASRLKTHISSDLHMSCAAQVFTAPIIFIFFKQVSLISPLANLLVSWTIPPLMVLGFLTALLGKMHFVLGFVPAQIALGILTYDVYVIRLVNKIPWSFFQF